MVERFTKVVTASVYERCLAMTVTPSRPSRRHGPSIRQPPRPLCGNDFCIHADPVEAAKQPPVLDFDAAVLHNLEARLARFVSRLCIRYAELHPQYPGADRDGVFSDWLNLSALAKA